MEESKANLHEAIELFYEHASDDEIEHRLKSDIFITNMQIAVGQAYILSGKEICKILTANGFEQVRQKGNHIIMQKENQQQHYHSSYSQSPGN